VGLLKYFSNNILHTFILPALIAKVLRAQTKQQVFEISSVDLYNQVIEQYPEIQKNFFLKWNETDVHAEIESILNYFVFEKLIRIDPSQNIHISNADPKIRLLSTFAHLYDVNVVKPAENDVKDK